jgi:superfamily II DNA or RNA helicase
VIRLLVGNTLTYACLPKRSLFPILDDATSYDTDPSGQYTEFERPDAEAWDGRVHLSRCVDEPNHVYEFPSGLRADVYRAFRARGFQVEAVDRRERPESSPSPYPPIPLWEHQQEAKAKLIHFGDGVAVLPPRCFKVGTPLVTFGGQKILVEDLTVGTLLPGPDGKPRKVQSLHRGYGPLFKVSRKYHDDFVVNGSHLLPLKEQVRRMVGGVRSSAWETTLLSVEAWNAESMDRKRRTRLYREPVVYASAPPLPLSPYLLGLLLGDGTLTATPAVTSSQPELIQALVEETKKVGLNLVPQDGAGKRVPTWYLSGTVGKLNPVTAVLRSLGLHGCTARTKFVPEQYKIASVPDRLELLAGLFDCDIDEEGEWVTASEKLCTDIREIAFSVGLQLSCTPKRVKGYDHTYWRCNVMGDVSSIPHRVKRKQREDNGWRDAMQSRFAVEPVGDGEFIGFELDGDKLFMMPDGTVQHNSGKTRCLLEVVREINLPTLWVAPTVAICEQTVAEAQKWFGEEAVVLGSSKNQDQCTQAFVVVMTTAAAVAASPEFYQSRQCLVVDEVHHQTTTNVWGRKLLALTAHIYHRKGMSGTFYRSGADWLALKAFLGRVAYALSSEEMLARGFLVPTRAAFVHVPGPKLRNTGADYYGPEGMGTQGIVRHSGRQNLVADCTAHLAARGRTTIVLVATKEQGRELESQISSRLLVPKPPGVEFNVVEFVSTDRPKGTIRAILKSFVERQEVKVLIGTSMVGEGVDLPPADALVYARGQKAKVSYVQALYRVCTAQEGKSHALVVDFSDGHHKRLQQHARTRWAILSNDKVFSADYLSDPATFGDWVESACGGVQSVL